MGFFGDMWDATKKVVKKTAKAATRTYERTKKSFAKDLTVAGKYVKQNGSFVGSDVVGSLAEGAGELIAHTVDKNNLLTASQIREKKAKEAADKKAAR